MTKSPLVVAENDSDSVTGVSQASPKVSERELVENQSYSQGLMQGAFGVTGVEGLYRSSCQAVLTALRRNRQAVTLLMEAILVDPLVEWAPNREDAAANQVGPPPWRPPHPLILPICMLVQSEYLKEC